MSIKTNKPAKNCRTRWWEWSLFAVIVMVMLSWFCWDLYAYGLAAPPYEQCSISEFAKVIPPPQHLLAINVDGQQRLVWVGEIPPFAIRSGPPCYVFARDGTLIDWTAETGEGSDLDILVLSPFQESAISLEEVLESIKQDNPKKNRG